MVTVENLKLDVLPEAARRELAKFYEFLVYKYLTDRGGTGNGKEDERIDDSVTAFRRFKQLRTSINPVVSSSIDVDTLINEVNNDIF